MQLAEKQRKGAEEMHRSAAQAGGRSTRPTPGATQEVPQSTPSNQATTNQLKPGAYPIGSQASGVASGATDNLAIKSPPYTPAFSSKIIRAFFIPLIIAVIIWLLSEIPNGNKAFHEGASRVIMIGGILASLASVIIALKTASTNQPNPAPAAQPVPSAGQIPSSHAPGPRPVAGQKPPQVLHTSQECLEYAKRLYNQGKLNQSGWLFDRLTLDKETSGEALYCLGLVNLAQARYVSAFKDLAEACKADPKNANARYYLGLIYDKRGDKLRAAQLYARAIAINPQHHAAIKRLAALANVPSISAP
jgi:hypothetical protein